MSKPTLAEQVVEILARRGADPPGGLGRWAADPLVDAVAGRLHQIRMARAFESFEADPRSEPNRRVLVELLGRQFEQDHGFRELVEGLVRARSGTPAAAEPSTWTGRRVATAVAVVAVVAGLGLGAWAVTRALDDEPQRDGSTPCRTFWALTADEQRELLAAIYRGKGEERRAEEPYLVSRVLYACGQNPERTVGQIVDASE